MLSPKCNIIINNNLKIKGCGGFVVDKDVENLSVVGHVNLPLHAIYRKSTSRNILVLQDEIKEGDLITIEAGYLEDEIFQVFKGYVTVIQKGTQLKLQIEDAIYLLRKKPVVINKKDIDLKDLISLLIEGTGLIVSDKTNSIKIDSFKYKGNAAGALAKLKESLSLTIYFDSNNELYAGGQQLNPKGKIKAIYGRNIIKNNTKYQTKDANPVQVEVIGKKADNTEVKKIVGMEGGSKYTLYKYNVTNENALQTIGEEYLNKYSFDGFKGKLKMFFIPFVEPGGSVEYENGNYEDKSGTYFVKGVKYSLSKGLKQEIEIGAKLL
jgi:hypothetical protein